MKKWAVVCVLGFWLLYSPLLGAEEFSQERALEHVRHLAETIGPRPMGSPQEREALEYFAAKLKEYGCEVDRHHIAHSDTQITSSGNVFGRLSGLSSREIVIGAHIDSATPEVPGANDDGSGVATVLELARVLSQTPHHATLLFVAFGGEESGLVGSNYFVEHYPLESVAMMLQLDMTSNDSPLLLWLDSKKHQCPRWLVSASIDIFHELGYQNIDYPTHFQSLNAALDGAGSDHEPFLRKGIPAIGFVSDLRHPIHTRNDNLDYFEPSGLERSGRLVLELIRKFDEGQPETKIDHYMLFLVGGKPFFIPPFLLQVFVFLSLFLSLFTLYRVRADRVKYQYIEDKKIRLSWPKLSAMLVIILLVITAADWMLRLVKGQRIYWYAYPQSHLLYLIPVSLLGIWIALQMRDKWDLRKDTFFYLVRASGYFWILIFLMWSYMGPRQAFYPAAALFLIALGCLAPWCWLKGVLWLLSPYLMFRLLLLPEYYEFVYRGVAQLYRQIHDPVGELVVSGIFLLFMFIWAMPFLLGFVAVYRSTRGDLFRLQRFRGQFFSVLLAGILVAGAIYLYTLPSYTQKWEQPVTITQKLEKDKTVIQYSSNDYLKGIVANIDWKFESSDLRASTKEQDYPLELDWIDEKIKFTTENVDEEKLVDLEFLFSFAKQPYTVFLYLDCDGPLRVEESNAKHTQNKKSGRVTMQWFSFPPRLLKPRLKLRIPPGSELKAELKATFLETPVEITCTGENKEFIF
ncbi:MAG: M28 family peptidase, partial [Candidatus Aminicenantes bacterium]|nr:M28 family peptidase [Candidatus Aminicenantes bacterium]